jgi:hypothetical protein
MSASLENVVVQSTKDFNKRIENLLGGKTNAEPEVQADANNTKKTMASLLLELTTIAAQLAHVDKTFGKVNDGAPEDPEARRWHDISVQALRTSRNMLSEKQMTCLNEIGALAGVPEITAAATGNAESEQKPLQSQGKTSSWDSWTPADIDACPEFVPPPPGLEQVPWKSHSEDAANGSLRKDLEMLRQAQPDTVLIVRKIKKLGFESPEMLRQHFGQYGPVQEILVAHSHVKPTPKRPNGRVRPAALGFVIMASPEGVKNAFEVGDVQNVCGYPVELKLFESFDHHYSGENEVGEDDN